MNCTFLDYEPFCRAALSQTEGSSQISEVEPLRADRIRDLFVRVYDKIDAAVLRAEPSLAACTPQRRALLALYGFIAVVGSEEISDSEIENLASSFFMSRQLAVA